MNAPYHTFPTRQAQTSGIYEIDGGGTNGDMPMMGKGQRAEKSDNALEIARRLLAIKPAGLSERQWCIDAEVSTSFFSNLRGTQGKAPADPSVSLLRKVLHAIGSSLPEFFIEEAKGRVIPTPNAQALEQAIRDALPGLPTSPDRRVQYLSAVVADVLALPPDRPATVANSDESSANGR